MTSPVDVSPHNRPQQSPLASRRGQETQGAPRSSSGLFPLGYKEGFSQWWTAISPAAAESAVLSFLPFRSQVPASSTSNSTSESTTSAPEVDPHGPRECSSSLVQLSGRNRAINEFSITRTSEGSPSNHLVMLHGYGAGLAFYYRNYDALSRLPGWKLWSLDLLGYGRSSRPPFVIKSKNPVAKIREAEDWFIDALEEWRRIRGIERFTLLGHSFGGYLSVCYCLKHPDRVNKLILASPVGVPEDPFAIQQAMPDEAGGQGEEIGKEFSRAEVGDTLGATSSAPVSKPPSPNSSHHSLSSKLSDPEIVATAKIQPKPRRPLPRWLTYLWDANISPFSLVRWSGPLGPRLVSGWTSRRFNKLPQLEAQALHNYSYSLFRQRGSGEYALAYVLAPGAYARRPLIWRVQDLVSIAGRGGVPSVWMYGEMDWMDVAGGFAAEEKIRSTPIDPSLAGPRNGYVGGDEWRGDKYGIGGEAKVLIVRNAGHHIYLDNHEEFNDMVLREMKDVEAREGQRLHSARERTPSASSE